MILDKPALYTDLYELTMAQGYFLSGRHTINANFDYFFRKIPFKGGYVVFAGLGTLLEVIKNFKFHQKEIEYLKAQGFNDSFLDYLSDFSFQGTIHSVKEGEIVFANEPILRVEGTILETQIIETVLLNILNFESLIATKASRLMDAAEGKPVLDFGLRRSQGFGGLQASKAAAIGGIEATSNVLAGQQFGVKVSGTMAHSWIQSFNDELTSFQTYAEHYPDSTILLIDTYNTLEIGLPNAIKVAKELEEKGHKLVGIRLDSGDLAYLSRQCRKELDKHGLEYVKIAVSNQLDEYVIKSLLDQEAPIDLFGVGTKLVTAYDDPALDGVYKLSSVEDEPTLKISENVEKITLPGVKKIIRFFNDDRSFNSDGILLDSEGSINTIQHPYIEYKTSEVAHLQAKEIMQKVVDKGHLVIESPSVEESRNYAKSQLSKLNEEHKRFDNPHVYKVGISRELFELKNHLIKNSK